jgi:hypothetical protein
MKNMIPKVNLEVLIVNRQTTGPGPGDGRLLESGRTRAPAPGTPGTAAACWRHRVKTLFFSNFQAVLISGINKKGFGRRGHGNQ